MSVRDDVEETLRGWNKLEIGRNCPPVIDYDCHPPEVDPPAAESRLAVLRRLEDLRDIAARQDEIRQVRRIGAHLAYLRALMGERIPLDDYVLATQGCRARGWPEEYVNRSGELARKRLEEAGITWGVSTESELEELERALPAEDAPDAIRQAASDLEAAVRLATGANAAYELTIATTSVDAYWSYWLDGAGQEVRLRLNLRNARFTEVRARQFALHEVLGHGLQSANLAERCSTEDVPWVRLLSVHAPQQVILEGLRGPEFGSRGLFNVDHCLGIV